MIVTLEGTISQKTTTSLVLETGGLGYEVQVTPEVAHHAARGDRLKLIIFEQIREDAHNLYGFADTADRDFFQQLLSVNGIGPKVAMGIMAAASREQLERAVATGNAGLLKGVAGIGQKTAERVVLELKGKLDGAAQGMLVSNDPAYQALINLGYSAAQAASALAALPADITDESQRLKAALKGIVQ